MSKIVLCVDDSATMQQVADITFRGTEFSYVGARSYEDGLEKAKAQKPAIVLVDAQIGSKSGYDLCLALKNDGTSAPVVILVGNGAAYDANRGAQVGADGSLPKPWDTQTMLEKVTEILGKGATAKPGAAAPAAPPQPVAAAAAPGATKSAPAAVPGPAAAAAAAAAGASAQPPRSATIMGMPTIKMPAGVAPTATAQPVPSRTTVMAVPPIAPSGGSAAPAAAAPAMRAPAPAAAPSAPAATPAPVMAGYNRAPMVGGSATKRSQLVERTLAKMASRLADATGLEPGSPELLALLKLSAEVVERIVWEVVPELAEQIIRENLQELTAQRRG